ncbi:MAG: MoxR family ATPase [Gammaproteobacteria bacterium]|nr:MoxR family ATPase [Gammaproteobacteria bacterium]
MNYNPTHFTLSENDTLEREGEINPYLFTENIAIALDVAFTTNRPLLVAGEPGSGKSRLAEAIAALKGWHFLSKTMTSRTRLEELTVELDHLRRMHDAYAGKNDDTSMKNDWIYHNPGIFWWAINHEAAKSRGENNKALAEDYGVTVKYPGYFRQQKNNAHHTVLLIDEIDKAEPDLPNDLLEPLDRRSFGLPNGEKVWGKKVDGKDAQNILTIITTNGERELPAAFLRRCVSLVLEAPDEQKLIEIANHHYPTADPVRVQALAAKIIEFRDVAKLQSWRAPSTSEFLDAVNACEDLDIDPSDQNDVWQQIEKTILIKKRNV